MMSSGGEDEVIYIPRRPYKRVSLTAKPQGMTAVSESGCDGFRAKPAFEKAPFAGG